MRGRKPLPRTTCAHCGQERRCSRLILDKAVCETCELRFARTASTCPGCGGTKVLAFYDAQHRPACSTCTGNEPRYACVRCGREDSPFGRRCGPCMLEERAAKLVEPESAKPVQAITGRRSDERDHHDPQSTSSLLGPAGKRQVNRGPQRR